MASKKYELIDEAENHFIMKHPDGSSFTIAKPGLAPHHFDTIRGMKVQSLSEGGEVEAEPAASDPSPAPSPTPEEDSSLAETEASREPASFAGNFEAPMSSYGKSGAVSPATQAPASPADLGLEQDSPPPAAGPEIASADRSKISSENIQTFGRPPQRKAAAEPRTAEDELKSAAGLEAAGIQGQAKAQAEQGKADAQAYGDLQTKLQGVQEQTQKHLEALNTESEGLYKDIVSAKVDPQRYMHSLSTGGRVQAAIAIALGGLGGGMSGHGGNVALDVINRAIDRDVDAQKNDIDNKKSLYAMNLQKTRNAQEAEAMTRSQLTAVTAAMVMKNGATAKGPEAQAQAQMLLGALKQKTLVQNQQLAVFRAQSTLASGGASGVNPEVLPEKVRERMVTLPNGQQRLAYSTEAAKGVRDQLETVQPIFDQLDNLDKLGASALIPGTAEHNKAQAIRGTIIPLLNENAGLKRLSPADIDNLNKQFRDPTKFSQIAGGGERSKELKKFLSDKLESSFKTQLEGYTGRTQRKERPASDAK